MSGTSFPNEDNIHIYDPKGPEKIEPPNAVRKAHTDKNINTILQELTLF